MIESELEKKLGKRLKDLGCLYFKFVSPGNTGVPDRLIILPGGRVIFVELKTESGRLTPLQFFQINRLQAQGCIVRVSYGMEDAEQLADDIKIMMEARSGI